jgi:hypothetical protein
VILRAGESLNFGFYVLPFITIKSCPRGKSSRIGSLFDFMPEEFPDFFREKPGTGNRIRPGLYLLTGWIPNPAKIQ